MTTATMQQPGTLSAIAARFVELCNQGKNFDVMRTLYSPDIVSVESNGAETVGQQAVIKKSERWAEANSINGQALRGPFFNSPTGSDGQFAIHFVHEVTRKDTGKPATLEEVAVYTVKNDKITREQFLYVGDR